MYVCVRGPKWKQDKDKPCGNDSGIIEIRCSRPGNPISSGFHGLPDSERVPRLTSSSSINAVRYNV